MYSKKALFPLQMCHIPKNTKAIQKMFHTGLDLYLLTICTILLGKVEETRNIKAGENDLTINTFIQVLPFIFRFRSTLSVIMRIL